MPVRKYIDGISLEPEVLKAVTQAFDQAWASIAGNFGSDPAVIDAARAKLAKALLSVAGEDGVDVEALKNGALQAMAEDYRRT